MSSIYKNQTKLKIVLQTDDRITAVTGCLATIETKNPNTERSFFPAEIINFEKGIIQYVVTSPNDFGVTGTWTIWAKIIDGNGLVSIGEPSIIQVKSEGR